MNLPVRFWSSGLSLVGSQRACCSASSDALMAYAVAKVISRSLLFGKYFSRSNCAAPFPIATVPATLHGECLKPSRTPVHTSTYDIQVSRYEDEYEYEYDGRLACYTLYGS